MNVSRLAAFRRSLTRRSTGERALPWLFLLPLLFFLAAFIGIPVLWTLFSSGFQDVPFLPRRANFPAHFIALVRDRGFLQSVRFTLLFIAVSVPLEIAAGLAFALLCNRPLFGRPFLRAAVLIPWAVPSAVAGRIWQLAYNYHYGLLNALGQGCGLFDRPVHWLGGAPGAFFSIVAADVWKTTPFVTILLLAGLQSIPGEILAQARVDRASPLQVFTRVTLPLLKPVIVVAFLFRSIDALRIFDLVFVLTRGAPGGATAPLSLKAYHYYLNGDFGTGSAVSVILFLIALALTLVYLRAGKFYGTLDPSGSRGTIGEAA